MPADAQGTLGLLGMQGCAGTGCQLHLLAPTSCHRGPAPPHSSPKSPEGEAELLPGGKNLTLLHKVMPGMGILGTRGLCLLAPHPS